MQMHTTTSTVSPRSIIAACTRAGQFQTDEQLVAERHDPALLECRCLGLLELEPVATSA